MPAERAPLFGSFSPLGVMHSRATLQALGAGGSEGATTCSNWSFGNDPPR